MIKPLKLVVMSAFVMSLMAPIDDVEAREVKRTFDVSPGGTLKLETSRGSIRVGTHNSDQVLVRVEIDGKNDEDMQIDFSNSGNDVTVIGEQTGESKSYWGGGYNMKVAYDIKVPKSYNLDVETAGGSIKIQDLNGRVDANTSGGSIKLGRIDGIVDVNTSGGSIKVDEVTGIIRAHTSGGSVKATISKQPTGDSKLTTSGGSIKVYLAEDIAVDLSARTSGGRVKSDFDVNGETSKRSIRGTINGGGPELILKTSGGSVKVMKL